MKFRCVDELNHFSFEDSVIRSMKMDEDKLELELTGAVVKAKNSQNTRYQDVFCGNIMLQLQNAVIARVVKEGLKYYDAHGVLKKEIPDEDIPESEILMVVRRCAKGTIFTIVEDDVKEGYAYEFGIDIPQEEDEDEVDTYWICVYFSHSKISWEKFCGPVNE